MRNLLKKITDAIFQEMDITDGLDMPSAQRYAQAAIEALRELPEDPGPRYSAGEYSRRNHQAMVDDALSR